MSEFFRPPRVTRSMAARLALLMVLAIVPISRV